MRLSQKLEHAVEEREANAKSVEQLETVQMTAANKNNARMLKHDE